MDRLRARVNTNDLGEDRERASKEPTATHPHPLRCGVCGQLYYVDDHTLRRAEAAARYDPGDIPFTCDACEDAYLEEGYARA